MRRKDQGRELGKNYRSSHIGFDACSNSLGLRFPPSKCKVGAERGEERITHTASATFLIHHYLGNIDGNHPSATVS
jgi:hypothetical protein